MTTPAKVYEAAQKNPALNAIIKYWEKGTFKTWEEAMTYAVVILANIQEDLLRQMHAKLKLAPMSNRNVLNEIANDVIHTNTIVVKDDKP